LWFLFIKLTGAPSKKEKTKMTFKDRTACFGSLTDKLKQIDLTIEKLEAKIKEMRANIHDGDEDMEVCPDEIEKAILELLKAACIDDMIEQEPEGDA